MEGTVYKSTGSWYTVISDDGASFSCRIKGKFRTQSITSTNPVAVGDRVRIAVEKDHKEGIITEIFPRKNYIVRKGRWCSHALSAFVSLDSVSHA